jgi:hypothetical protein
VGARTGRHEELGILSCSQLLNEFAFHDLGHIRQVAELYRSHAFYPKMGVFQLLTLAGPSQRLRKPAGNRRRSQSTES